MGGRFATDGADWTYLTPRRVYRRGVSEADGGPGGDLPVIRLDVDDTRPISQLEVAGVRVNRYTETGHGHNAQLALYVTFSPASSSAEPGLVDGILADGESTPHADLRVWMLASQEGRGYDAVAADPDASVWVLIHEQSVICSTAVRLRDIEAGKYCVTVDALVDGSVTILESHTT